ncbi:uncharacterized protein LOC120187415 [Hibiscus syriacus]|uniref:uncharacterized protein LOC120187415 n=1 Tax=Hibiscus syriacus TaxID=106335 RepID=UPI00192242A9|nr:uncharacterized protein LOC120187415 [Hibiscus syriacus]
MFDMLYLIGQFGGAPHEDARQHVRAFLEVCDSFQQQGVHEDVLKLKLFPYSLNYRVRAWLNGVLSGSIKSWADLYKGHLRKCTNNGFHDWMQVVMFYHGINALIRLMLDVAANGTLLDKSLEEAFDIFDRIANNDYQFFFKVKNGEKDQGTFGEVKEVKVPISACILCHGNNVNECPDNHESANYMRNFNRGNNNPYSNTYNRGWLQYPNFRINEPTMPAARIDNTIWLNPQTKDFMTSTKVLLHKHSSTIKSQGILLQSQITLLQSHSSSLRALEKQLGQIATALHARPQGSLPSDTKLNQKDKFRGKKQEIFHHGTVLEESEGQDELVVQEELPMEKDNDEGSTSLSTD